MAAVRQKPRIAAERRHGISRRPRAPIGNTSSNRLAKTWARDRRLRCWSDELLVRRSSAGRRGQTILSRTVPDPQTRSICRLAKWPRRWSTPCRTSAGLRCSRPQETLGCAAARKPGSMNVTANRAEQQRRTAAHRRTLARLEAPLEIALQVESGLEALVAVLGKARTHDPGDRGRRVERWEAPAQESIRLRSRPV